jgi:hypothetical protein
MAPSRSRLRLALAFALTTIAAVICSACGGRSAADKSGPLGSASAAVTVCTDDVECAPTDYCGGRFGNNLCGKCMPRAGLSEPCWMSDVRALCADGLRCTGPGPSSLTKVGPPGTCLPFAVVTVGAGEVCVSQDTLQDDSAFPPSARVCGPDLSCIRGKCVAPRTLGVGQTCIDGVEVVDCVAGARCDYTMTGTCKALGATSAACADDDECVSAHCDATAGHCVDGGSLGAPCENGCVAGLFCNDADSTCVPRIEEGGACSYQTSCREGLECNWRAVGATVGTCERFSLRGGHCDESLGCETGTTCIANVCAGVAQKGDPCDATAVCDAGLLCRSGRCWLPSELASCAAVVTASAVVAREHEACNEPDGRSALDGSSAVPPVSCPPGVVCAFKNGGTEGSCEKPVPVGASDRCDLTAGIGCAPGYDCLASTDAYGHQDEYVKECMLHAPPP